MLAGVVCGLVGFTSSFAVVLTGLRAVGADPEQAASGLLVLCVTMGLGCVLFSWRLRMPVTMAWSTPGAALLAAATVPAGGFASAVGAFVVCGLLLALCGLVRPLERLVEAIPKPLASAMLAGVLLTLCVAPFRAVVASPAAIAPVMVTWLVLVAVARRWAVIGALGAALVVMAAQGVFGRLDLGAAAPSVVLVATYLGRDDPSRRGDPALHRHDDEPEHPRHGRARVLRLPARHPRSAALHRWCERARRRRRRARDQPRRDLRGARRRSRGATRTAAGAGSRVSRAASPTSPSARSPGSSRRQRVRRPPASSRPSPASPCSAPSRVLRRPR